MAQDVSGFGTIINIIASNTFPFGVVINQFADDADPFDAPEITIGDTAMGLNGDLISWSKAAALKTKVAVINGSADDINLGIIFEANRTGRGKVSAQDIITMTVIFPSGATITWTGGKIVSGMPGSSVASAGRLKTKSYGFDFENIIQTAAL
jgi:hypothetical protein